MQNNAEKIVARYILNQRIAQVVAALCIPVPVLIYLFQPSLILFVVETIVFVFILYAFRIICAFFNITKLNSILVRQCDPETFISVFQLLKTKSVFRKRITNVNLNIAYGLSLQGKYQEARDILREINIYAHRPNLILYYITIYAFCAKMLEEYDHVQWSLSEAIRIEGTQKLSKAARKAANREIKTLKCDLDEYNKQYDLALETAKECFISAIQPLAKITSAYSLAKLHFLKGDYASAITKCKYVIKHGNKLHCVVLARQLLEECEKL